METKKTQRKICSKWEQSSERALLEVWGEKMGELRGCRKNSHILMEMVAELEAQGFKYSVLELQRKMHNMTARYRKEKQKVGTTGGSPSEWDLYKEMEVLLAPYKSYHSEELVADSINDIIPPIVSQQTPPVLPSPLQSLPVTIPSPFPSPVVQENSPSSSPAIKKREGFQKLLKKIEENMEDVKEIIKSTSERALALEDEKKEILKGYTDREAEVQKALVEFLKRP